MNKVKFGKIGIHTLTAFPPANLNRDEDGRPKTAMVGGVERLRVSSQARKRPWRLSDFMASVDAHRSVRTRELGTNFKQWMIDNGADEKLAEKAATLVANGFGAVKKGALNHEETVVYGREEWDAAMKLAKQLAKELREPTVAEVEQLPRDTGSVDVAMFGRMRAAQKELNVDSSIAVSPLLSTHAVAIEADNWTALDDLNPIGSAGMGEIEFSSAVMYGYVCIDVDSLVKNLHGDERVAKDSISAFMRAVAFVGPQAMRSRFAQDALPELYRVESGPAVYSHQGAFNEAVTGQSMVADSIARLKSSASDAALAYGLDLEVLEVSPEMPLDSVIESVVSAVIEVGK